MGAMLRGGVGTVFITGGFYARRAVGSLGGGSMSKLDDDRPNYAGRHFRSLENSDTGEVGDGTVFRYHQEGDLVWANYSGGEVRHGTLVARADDHGVLDMRYHHLNSQGELKTGICRSQPEILPDGRLRLHEEWQWTSGDSARGSSLLEEIPREEITPAGSSEEDSEACRIVRLLRSTFDGEAWHGTSLWNLVAGLTAQQAGTPPLVGEHSPWELVGHATAWMEVVYRRVTAEAIGEPDVNFPVPETIDSESWKASLAALRNAHEALCSSLLDLTEERLSSTDPASGFTVYEVLHGVVHHNLYHAGQIALLRRSLGL